MEKDLITRLQDAVGEAYQIEREFASGGQSRLFIADDAVASRKVVIKLLPPEMGGAVEAERFKPHVMLLDVHLGEGDIKQISSFVRGDDDLQMCKIIAMSGKLTDGQLAGMKGQGFDGFLKKPFAVRQVVEAIEHATSLVN